DRSAKRACGHLPAFMSKVSRLVHVHGLNLWRGLRVPCAGTDTDLAMRSGWIHTALLLIPTIIVAPARAEGPGPDLKFHDEPRNTFTSPDDTLKIEHYSKDGGDDGFSYQFWLFDKDHKNAFLLNRDEDKDLAHYPAGFRFSPDSRWLVRMQGIGAGFATL